MSIPSRSVSTSAARCLRRSATHKEVRCVYKIIISVNNNEEVWTLPHLSLIHISCKLTTATYFVYEGQRYDVLYWQPHYKRRDRLEVMLKLVVEDA